MENIEHRTFNIERRIAESVRGIEDIAIGKVAGLSEAEFRKALRTKSFKQKETKGTKRN